ncbi:MAG: hypothetical protein EBV20_07390 [Betaproteobacteria bacterium]|nr:hypothetical protein [Betaproteobacteria bacterium]
MAPSQPGAAVAGVQEEFLQHSPEELFQTSPAELRQLLTTWAEAAEAKVMAASKRAKRLNFFMMLLGELVAKRNVKDGLGMTLKREGIVPYKKGAPFLGMCSGPRRRQARPGCCSLETRHTRHRAAWPWPRAKSSPLQWPF